MYFLDVVQGVRPTGFLKDYPSVPNSTWAWEDDATVGVWSLASDWLILMQVNVYCFVQILLMVSIDDDLAWRLLKSKMHSPRCLCQIEKQSYRRPIFNAQNFERTLVALESSPVPISPMNTVNEFGGSISTKTWNHPFSFKSMLDKTFWFVFGLVV